MEKQIVIYPDYSRLDYIRSIRNVVSIKNLIQAYNLNLLVLLVIP